MRTHIAYYYFPNFYLVPLGVSSSHKSITQPPHKRNDPLRN